MKTTQKQVEFNDKELYKQNIYRAFALYILSQDEYDKRFLFRAWENFINKFELEGLTQ